jgi:tetratricopeptide (TPR) repeat protein
VRGNQGRISEALTTFEEGMDLASRYGDHFWAPRMPNCVGWIYREMQDFDRAIKYDMQGFDIGRHHNVLEAQANSLINLGIDYRHSGEGVKTLAVFHQVERIFERDAWFRWRYNIRLQAGKCEDSLARGDVDAAYENANRLLEIATRYEARKYIAVAHNLLAQIAVARGNPIEAESELNVALAELRLYPVPIVEWKTLAALGRLRSQTGDGQGAREAFSEASRIINSIAANVEDEGLRTIFLGSAPVREVISGETLTAP